MFLLGQLPPPPTHGVLSTHVFSNSIVSQGLMHHPNDTHIHKEIKPLRMMKYSRPSYSFKKPKENTVSISFNVELPIE